MPRSVDLREITGPAVRASTWLAVGVGGPQVSAQGWDPEQQGPVLLVGGHPGSGRSTTLLALAESALQRGRALVVVLPRRSPLHDLDGQEGVTVLTGLTAQDAERLELAVAATGRSGSPPLLLVDDVEAVDGSPVEPVLARLVSGMPDSGLAVAAAGSTPEMLSRFSGLSVRLRRAGVGLVLGPAGPVDGDLLGVRLARQEQRLPGRGVLVDRGRCVPVQVATAVRVLR